MTTTWLAYFPSPPRGVWHLGPLPIRAYAVFIIIGIVAALLIGDRRWEARGGERGVIYDIAMWAVPFGLLGGRLYHLATDWQTYWGPGGAGFGAALRIWDGGLGIWGAVALGGVGAWIGCRRRGIPLPAFGDALAPGLVLAQAIGRLGNYFNQELYGRETTLPWGLQIFYRRDPSGFVDPHSLDGVSTGQVALVVQPTFLYELIWNVLVFVALIYVDRRYKLGHGRLFAVYVAAYCVGRFCVELLRDDAATHIAGIRINSFTSTFVFIGAVVYIILAPKGREDPETLRGTYYVPLEPEPATELASVAAASAAVSVAGAEGSTESLESGRVAEAESDEPETVKAEVAEAEAEPEPGDPEVAEPEVAEAQAEEPEPEEPEVVEHEAAEAEVEEPEAEAPEVAEPEALEPEALEPEATEPEAAEPEAAEPEAVEAEAEEPAAEAPEPEAEAEIQAEDAEATDAEAEAEADQPAAAEPEAEESAHAEGDLAADEDQPEESADDAALAAPGASSASDVEAQDGDEQPEPAKEAAEEAAEEAEPASEPETDAKPEESVTEKAAAENLPEEEAEPTRRRWGFGLRNRRGR
ncbi:prolipoprotein diacylglyceryl transferase [Mycobacterium sp.]|uniref:prolipoprotein diacylglyceryl transferase n=1 Tax=Mycobacterium sp. TaxID=1785 RepID=UPI003F9AF549